MTAFPGLLQEDLENGEDVATCPSCSLIVRVIYDQVGAGRGLCGRSRPAVRGVGQPSRIPVRHPVRRERWQLLKVPGKRGVGSWELVAGLFVAAAPASSLSGRLLPCLGFQCTCLCVWGWNTDKTMSAVLRPVHDSSSLVFLTW